jgi:hypothetical protein
MRLTAGRANGQRSTSADPPVTFQTGKRTTQLWPIS